MNTCAISECSSNRLNCHLGPLTPDVRLTAINRVLDLLLESRFGPGCWSEELPPLGENRYAERVVEMDLHRKRFYAEPISDAQDLMLLALSPSPCRAIGRRVALGNVSLTTSHPNRGRGSPVATRHSAIHHFLTTNISIFENSNPETQHYLPGR